MRIISHSEMYWMWVSDRGLTGSKSRGFDGEARIGDDPEDSKRGEIPGIVKSEGGGRGEVDRGRRRRSGEVSEGKES